VELIYTAQFGFMDVGAKSLFFLRR